jgi:hypothetical protein
MYPVVFTQRCRAPAAKLDQFLTICARASFSDVIQDSNVCRDSAPNISTRAFADVWQVIAISTVATPLAAALATAGVARLKQNRPVARSFRLVVHDGVGSPSVTLSFGFIVRLLGYGNLLAKCMKPEMEAARTTERRTPTQWFAWKPL